MEKTVNYVVACFAGTRRHYVDGTPIIRFVEQQLLFLQQQPKYINQATFVFNQCNTSEELEAITKSKQYKLPIPLEIIIRENTSVSYGAWETALLQQKSSNFAFLIEDDYLPTRLDFLDFFFIKQDKTVKFVASLFDRNHAAIANGLISIEIVKKTKAKFGKLFDLQQDNTYAGGSYYNQIHFLDFIEGEIVDITDVGYTEFLDAGKNIMEYRNSTLPLLIAPILV